MLSLLVLPLFAPQVLGAVHFKWPDHQMDYIDETLWGNGIALSSFVKACFSTHKTTIAAEWIRTAYHDMATHDIDSGTGGLDASIIYEVDRAQNAGIEIEVSLIGFNSVAHPYVSMADIIALGVVASVNACGGPMIPFHAGRIDATSAGPETVPEPHQDLASHIESFRRQGYTQEEMVAFVACGHSLGGVRRDDFPDIVKEGTKVASFNTASGRNRFVPIGVTEYLDGTTQNPLVVGHNKTTNSDLRIFSSDKNVTMQRLSSPETFHDTCRDLFGRMINTIPKGITLTDVVDPIDQKVGHVQLYPTVNGFALLTKLRLHKHNSNRDVKMLWSSSSPCVDDGCPPAPPTSKSDEEGTFLLQNLPEFKGDGVTWYSFSIESSSPISRFWYEISEESGAKKYSVDNHGEGFLVDTTVLFDPSRTTDFLDGDDFYRNIHVAVLSTSITPNTKVTLEAYGGNAETLIPSTRTVEMVVDSAINDIPGYTYYTAAIEQQLALGFHIVYALTGGEHEKIWVSSSDFDLE